MTITVLLLQAYLGLTLLGAATGKARSALRGRGNGTATWLLVVAEMGAGFCLVAGLWPRLTALAVAGFLGAGVATKAVRRWRNPYATCGCVGEPRRIDAAEIGGCAAGGGRGHCAAAAAGHSLAGGMRGIVGVTVAAVYLTAAATIGRLRPVCLLLERWDLVVRAAGFAGQDGWRWWGFGFFEAGVGVPPR